MRRLQDEVKRTEAADAAKGVLRSGQHLHRVQELTLDLASEYLEALAKDLTELLERFERLDETTGSWLKSRVQEAHEGLLKSQTEGMKARAKRIGLPPASIDASLLTFGQRMASIASRIGTSVDIAVNKAALESSRSQQRAAASKTSILGLGLRELRTRLIRASVLESVREALQVPSGARFFETERDTRDACIAPFRQR
jgi:hypothetical protein